MRLFAKETWSYAILLVILFGIATIAVWQTISYLETRVPEGEAGLVAVLLWTLTLGFMLIAGAFGLWAVQFSAEAESRRRIAQVVTAMDFLRDGLLAVDHRGRVTGMNPAAQELLGDGWRRKTHLRELFHCLSEADADLLLSRREPEEVERLLVDSQTSRTLRFRSQPTRGLALVLISDVTATQARRIHKMQSAKLQLIGQLARGVANDFNNLLCGISGHAALLPRLPSGSREHGESIRAIAAHAEKGVALAGHLLELSQPGAGGYPTGMVAEHVRNAAEVLRDNLAAGWQVDPETHEMPATSLTGMQIEQAVLNLGQLVADSAPGPQHLLVICGPPGTHPLLDIGSHFAGGVVVTGTGVDADGVKAESPVTPADTGIILSVIRSILEGADGTLDQLAGADGVPVFRLCLPLAASSIPTDNTQALPFDIGTYLAHWSVLVAGQPGRQRVLENRLREFDTRVIRVDSVSAILARIEDTAQLDAIVIDWPLLGSEEEGLLKALVKLCPATGIVVLREDAQAASGRLPGVVYVPDRTDTGRILMAMVEARSLAASRSRARA